MKAEDFRPVFVDDIPNTLDEGHIYISIRYRTASHLCACGCRTQVVTPIKPAKWELTYNGEAIWLAPSIDRSQSPCGSHYWIRRSRIQWYPPLSEVDAQRTRERDARDLRAYYNDRAQPQHRPAASAEKKTARLWSRLWARRSGG